MFNSIQNLLVQLMVLKLLRHFWLFNRMLEESRPSPSTWGSRMPTCRYCLGTFSRDQFIRGTGPRAQVCIRCAVDMKIATEEETENLYSEKLRNARLSLVARRYSMFLYIPVLWTLWGMYISSVEPWGLYFLLLLIALTLFAPVWFFIRSAHFAGNMARLTPEYERPKGH